MTGPICIYYCRELGSEKIDILDAFKNGGPPLRRLILNLISGVVIRYSLIKVHGHGNYSVIHRLLLGLTLI